MWQTKGNLVVDEDGQEIAMASNAEMAATIAQMPRVMATLSILVDWAAGGGLRSWQLDGIDAVDAWSHAVQRVLELKPEPLRTDLPKPPEGRRAMALAEAEGILHLITRLHWSLRLMDQASSRGAGYLAWKGMVCHLRTLQEMAGKLEDGERVR